MSNVTILINGTIPSTVIPHNPITCVRTRLTQSLSGLAWVGNCPRASALLSLFLLLLASETTSSKPHPAVTKGLGSPIGGRRTLVC